MKQREFTDDTVQLATRVPKQLHVRVRINAIDTGRTMQEWVGDALREHLDACQGKKRAGKAAKAANGSAPSAA